MVASRCMLRHPVPKRLLMCTGSRYSGTRWEWAIRVSARLTRSNFWQLRRLSPCRCL